MMQNKAQVFLQKDRIRRQVLRERNQLSPAVKETKSRQILHRLLQMESYKNAAVIHSYVSKADEVDTHALIIHSLKQGKKVIVPRVVKGSEDLEHYFIQSFADLQPGTFQILEPDPKNCEPATLQRIDLVVVPGVAFDRQGNRLGYGKGYYDRFLQQVTAPRLCLAFSLQILPELPTRAEDIPMDFIITEADLIKTHRRDLFEASV